MLNVNEKNYITSRALGVLLGITDERVRQLEDEGILESVTEKGKKLFDLTPNIQKYITHLKNKLQNAAPDEILIEAADAEMRFKKAKADKMELELAELKAQMHRSEDVEAVVGDMISAIRAAICSIPGYVAVDCAKAQTAEEASKVVRESVNIVLESLMRYQYDPKVYAKLVRDREKWMSRNDEEENAPVQEPVKEKRQRAPKEKKTTPAKKTGGFDKSVGKRIDDV